MEMRDLLRVFKALSDETRLRMLKLLLRKEELCVCEIMQAMDISQTRASRNLGVLQDAGILRSRRVGPWVHYALDDDWAKGEGRDIINLLQRSGLESALLEEDVARLEQAVKLDPRNCAAGCAAPGFRAAP